MGAMGWGLPVSPVSQHALMDVTGVLQSPVGSWQLHVHRLGVLGGDSEGGLCKRHRFWGPDLG